MRASPQIPLRSLAVMTAVGLLLGSGAGASADTRTQLTVAKERLRELEARISSERAALISLQATLNESAAKVDHSKALYDAIQIQLTRSRRARERTEARYDEIRASINQIAVNVYIRGPISSSESMSPKNMLDASAAIEYAGAIIASHQAKAEEAQRLAQELKQQQQQEHLVMEQRASVLDRYTADQNELLRRFDEQRDRLVALSAARAEATALLTKLRAQLRAEELAAARAALAGGLTFGNWAKAFLGSIHAPVTHANLVVMVAWETQEFTEAKWNPLATTYAMPGSTMYNSSGVRNYVSLSQGLDATERTLRRPGYGYEQILVDLARSADSMTTAEAIRDSYWCHGCTGGEYVVRWIPRVEQYYDSYANARP